MPSYFRRISQSLTATELKSQFTETMARPKSSYKDYASVTSARERLFDTSQFQLSFIARDPVTQEQMMNQYAIKNLTIPRPVSCKAVRDAQRLKKMPKGFYDTSLYQFEEIKQLRNYDQMIASQLGQRQQCQFSRLNMTRKKDPFIQMCVEQADNLRQNDFHYSPVRTYEKIGSRPIFALPLREEKPVILNKTRITRMNQITSAIDVSDKWREERKLRLSGAPKM